MKISIIISIIFVSIYFLINFTIGDSRFDALKVLLDNEQQNLIKKYIFPRKIINSLEQSISQQKKNIEALNVIAIELDKKENGSDIGITESIIKLSSNKTLKKYKLDSGFYAGISNLVPGSGYIDFFKDDIFILSSRGILAFRKNLIDDQVNFQQVKNNINDFLGIEQFKKSHKFSLKDLLIFNEKIYISYTDEIKQNCWNTSVIYGDINYDNIQFKKLFSAKECIHSINNVDKEFEVHQSGGRIISFKDNHILLTMGDYRSRHLGQNIESLNGKILKININNNDHEIISMGHRNPQGLYFDKENNFILETEHGPKGGDEINLIEVKKINEGKIQNYGWPIASAGVHYIYTKKKKEKYPLYKSHSKYGFIEPLKSFIPSIGISEIVKIEKNNYVVSSMRDKSLYFFELNEKREIINLERVGVLERIRDLRFQDNKLYLFMEDTASLGVINLK
ncbi:PQQ-dependent sugar dehydrogenase [Candidatus Pelagibacter sp.]|nr:PQQ-dependent sugar dehydrogenase [Candidatus Pelagibacter sp.]